MTDYEHLLVKHEGETVRITMNRPERRNALSEGHLRELLDAFEAAGRSEATGIVLAAEGKAFSAGHDFADVAARDLAGVRDLLRLCTSLMHTIQDVPQVVIARVQGAALGGGLGLVCVSDIAVAGYSASFGLPEAQLGLAPALISPYVLARLGFTRTRELMLTGVRFDYLAAHNWGLIQHYCADFELDARVRAVLRDVLRAAPEALRACKELLFTVAAGGDTLDYRAALLERLRTGEEARLGATAFLQKQPAPWAIERIDDFDDVEDA